MKVIIEQTAAVDYPQQFLGNPQFYKEQETKIRKRLSLRATDKVEIRETSRHSLEKISRANKKSFVVVRE